MAHWGKAGVRLTETEIRERRQRAAQRRFERQRAREQAANEAYPRWRAGGVVPAAITFALDALGLYGPEVDRACGAEEPAVDLWEAGKLYPTWEQLCALADLTGRTPGFFVQEWPTFDPRSTTLRFHIPAHELEAHPPVLRADLDAIHAVTVGAPEKRP